jgi:membrane glycosyltransferase
VAGAAATRPARAVGDKARARAQLVAQAADDGPSALDRTQRHRLLGDAAALSELRERVMLRQAHPAWWQAAEPASTVQPSLQPAARPAQDERYAGQPGVALGG